MAMDLLTTVPTWTAKVSACRTPEEVVDLAKGFIATRPVSDWAMLPSDCQPPALTQVDDVNNYAVVLMQREFRFTGPAAAVHYDAMDFFVGASRRLAEISSPAIEPHPFFSRDAYLTAAGATMDEPQQESMDDKPQSVWVYRYHYWDDESHSRQESKRFATIDVIRCGLGEVILSSGKKVTVAGLVDGAFSE